MNGEDLMFLERPLGIFTLVIMSGFLLYLLYSLIAPEDDVTEVGEEVELDDPATGVRQLGRVSGSGMRNRKGAYSEGNEVGDGWVQEEFKEGVSQGDEADVERRRRLAEEDARRLVFGIIGNSGKPLKDPDYVREEIRTYLKSIKDKFDSLFDVWVATGVTKLGVPMIAVEEAKNLGLKTIGFGCNRAFEYELNDVDKSVIVGEEWGDESQTFLDHLDSLMKISGGEQSKREYAAFKGSKVELPETMREKEEDDNE